jgi:Asp-tRNA(Asn)/Glu-tRNA(Gln) amidotransferase A subunit family amidase
MADREEQIIGRLIANLKAAGIKVDDEDLEGMRESGFLAGVVAFEEAIADVPVDLVPDYLKDWGEGHPPGDAPSSGASAGGASVQAGTVFGAPGEDLDDDPLRYASIVEIAGLLKRGEISSAELTHLTIERISDHDPILNAFQAVLTTHALSAARRADAERAAGIDLGPLHGVPIAAKDLLAMRGTTTTAGSIVLAGWETDFDAAGIERLEAAGAVIVGKTRMSEFAYSPGSNNAHYGETHNPWNLDHDTGGSSSGSAAAVADGLVYGALGTDTGCSIRAPSALCGIVGLKPTFGRVSLYGAVTLAWSLDHLGPMTRTVADAAVMLNVLAGYDERDHRTRHVPVPDYTAELNAGVRGLRIGVLSDDGSDRPLASDEALASWHRSLRLLEAQGAVLVDVAMPQLDRLRPLNSGIVAGEAAAYHEPNLAIRLEDYGPYMRRRVLSAYAHGPIAFVRANQARRMLRRQSERLFDRIDVLSTPAMPYEAPILGDPSRNTWFMGPFNSLGWPALVVPVSLSQKRLPFATQFVGKPWDESTVLRVGATLESARGRVA